MFTKEINVPYLAIKLILGEITEDEIEKYSDEVKTELTSLRYFDQIYFE
jgi:hypothetical protein